MPVDTKATFIQRCTVKPGLKLPTDMPGEMEPVDFEVESGQRILVTVSFSAMNAKQPYGFYWEVRHKGPVTNKTPVKRVWVPSPGAGLDCWHSNAGSYLFETKKKGRASFWVHFSKSDLSGTGKLYGFSLVAFCVNSR